MKKNKKNIEHELKNILAEKIKQLRDENNLSQHELAEKIGIHQINFGRYERGESLPSIDSLKKLSEVFGVSTDYLLSNLKNETPDFKISDPELVKKLKQIKNINTNDYNILNGVIDLIIAKNQIKTIVTK